MKLKGHREDHFPSPKNRETTRDERLQIITLRKHTDKSWREIEAITKIKRSTCRQIWKRYLLIGTPSNRPRIGRPTVFTDALKLQLVTFVTSSKRTRRLSWEEIKQELGYNCSARLLKETLQSIGYNKRMPRKK